MRVVAIIAARNEELLIGPCLEHLFDQGVAAYLIDNGSTDRTVAIAERYRRRGLIGIESLPYDGSFRLRDQLERKERLAGEVDADWLIHQDVDEFRVSTRRKTLHEELASADREGFSAVNFLEFTFVPTREDPHHEHPHFRRTMRWYYPFLPRFPHQLNAWKRQETPVELVFSAGHRVSFPGLQMAPESLGMRHYICLSRPHAVRKFAGRRYDPGELAGGWHRWRASLRAELLSLPWRGRLRPYVSDDRLDRSRPERRHLLGDATAPAVTGTESSSRARSSPPQSSARTRGSAQRSEPVVRASDPPAQA